MHAPPEADLVCKVRRLLPDDLPDLLELSSLAGWNQTEADWRMLLILDPEGCFGIEIDGRILATATLLRHGLQFAWLGMVLTHPEYRRRGLARRLLTCVLNRAREFRIATIMLDATDTGQSLYESFGFRGQQSIERWVRSGLAREVSVKVTSDLGGLLEMDRETCGYDRSETLRALSMRSRQYVERSGYLLCRSGRVTSYLGPAVAQSFAAADCLISAALGNAPETAWCWDLLPRHEEAVALARSHGFTPARKLTRMVLGEEPCTKQEWLYAIAGFELG